MGLKQDLIAGLGEFTGTTLFLFLALGGAKTAQVTRTQSQIETVVDSAALGNQTIMYISVSFGLSLLTMAWVFYRVTGGLFNPAITLALYLIGGLSIFRAILLTLAQLAGGIAGAALVAGLTPFGGVNSVTTTLAEGVSVVQGFFIEAFLTAMLVLTVLLLAAEKHKSTYLAPIGIGLLLFSDHLVGIAWTGCGINPARSFGPAVVSASFPGYHWIYWVGPIFGSLLAVGFYMLLKTFDYTSVVFGQDADHELTEHELERQEDVNTTLFTRAAGKALVVYHARAGHQGQSEMVRQFDSSDAEMADAIRRGEASLVDPAMAEKGLVEQALTRGESRTNGYVVGAREDREKEEARSGKGDGGGDGGDGGGVASPASGTDTTLTTTAVTATAGGNGNGGGNGNQAKPTSTLQTIDAPGVVAPSQPHQGGHHHHHHHHPTMRAEAQDLGGLQVPGTIHQGIARSSRAREVLHQQQTTTSSPNIPKED